MLHKQVSESYSKAESQSKDETHSVFSFAQGFEVYDVYCPIPENRFYVHAV